MLMNTAQADRSALIDREKDILLAEYVALKAEQTSRIVVRDRLVYAALAASVASLALVIQSAGRVSLLLLLPVVCTALGWTYFVNDQKISAIGTYLGQHLSRSLVVSTRGGARFLTWEWFHRRDPRRRLDKSMQLAVDLLMFVAPALSAVVVYWTAARTRPDLLVVSAVEALIVLGFGARVIAAADLSPTKRD